LTSIEKKGRILKGSLHIAEMRSFPLPKATVRGGKRRGITNYQMFYYYFRKNLRKKTTTYVMKKK